MKFIQSFIMLCFTFTCVFSESFFVLTGVKNYEPVVANMSPKTQQYSTDIKTLMKEMTKEIGVDTSGHPSRVLVFVISDISLGDTVGLEVKLELGEYVLRKGNPQSVFGATYIDTKRIAPDFKDEEDVDDKLADAVEEMLERFKRQYQDDNKVLSKEKTAITHESFAADMGYETNYETALSKAKKEGKSLLLFMTTSYCPWCRKLESRILAQRDIDKQIKEKYVPLMLNLDKDTYPQTFAKTRFTPILYIVNAKDESIIHKFVGYSSREEFLHVLKLKK